MAAPGLGASWPPPAPLAATVDFHLRLMGAIYHPPPFFSYFCGSFLSFVTVGVRAILLAGSTEPLSTLGIDRISRVRVCISRPSLRYPSISCQLADMEGDALSLLRRRH